jgi:hypothetical protein
MSIGGAFNIIGGGPEGLYKSKAGGAPYVYLLDLYPNAAAAYSVRLLNSAYTGFAIRVRRSSDNTEQNISFVNNELDTASLLTFCGASNGFITTFYDQSGNSNNATQGTAANQYRIVDSGVLYTNLGKPALFNNSNTGNLIMGTRTTNTSVFLVRKTTMATGARNFILGDTSTFNYHPGSSTYLLTAVAAASVTSGNNYSNGVLKNFILDSYPLNSTDLISMIHNGTANSNCLFQDRGQTANVLFGYIQEVILYGSDQAANRVGIQDNINNYYAIY